MHALWLKHGGLSRKERGRGAGSSPFDAKRSAIYLSAVSHESLDLALRLIPEKPGFAQDHFDSWVAVRSETLSEKRARMVIYSCPFRVEMAPRDRLELPTKWLQVPWYFHQAWTISSPVPIPWAEGVGRFPSGIYLESTSRSSSLCTFPEQRLFRAWLRITILHNEWRAGFPEFTRFFNHDFSWKLQFTSTATRSTD